MQNIRLAVVLTVLASVFPVMAADPVLDLVKPASQTCDPNRQCTTHAECGEFGDCASWRRCICTG